MRPAATRPGSALRRELAIAAVLTTPFLVQMVAMFVAGASTHDELLPRWLQLALATPVQFVIGRRFYVGAWHALRGGGANMDVLIVLGTSIAWLWSAVVTVLGVQRARLFRGVRGDHHARAARQGARGARASAGTSAAMEGLLRLQPNVAHVERDGRALDVPLADVVVGDRFAVRAGEADSRRRHRRRRRVIGRRGDADGREPPGREVGGRHRLRGHA